MATRIERSYQSYLNHRQEWREKGYGLDRELTRSEYAEAQATFIKLGEKHPARKIAQQDRTVNRSEALSIVRRLRSDAAVIRKIERIQKKLDKLEKQDNPDKNAIRALNKELSELPKLRDLKPEKVKALANRFKKASDVYGLELDAAEQLRREEETIQRLEAKGKKPSRPVQSSARADLFAALIDAGYDYSEADELIYG